MNRAGFLFETFSTYVYLDIFIWNHVQKKNRQTVKLIVGLTKTQFVLDK